MDKEFILECKINTLKCLTNYFKATKSELKTFTDYMDTQPAEDWTCGIVDELAPTFYKINKRSMKEYHELTDGNL